MRRAYFSFLSAAALVLSGCASSYQIVQFPERNADLYPRSQTKAGVTIAIDEIRNASRAERYFGADLIKERILPVMVVVSNHGKDQVIIKPSDILLYRGRDIIDPLPVEFAIEAAKRQHWFLRSKTEQQVEGFFEKVLFRETTLFANETYQGVMFFPMPKPENVEDTSFTVLRLSREGGPKIRIGVTNIDTTRRLHFGPFSVSFPESQGRS